MAIKYITFEVGGREYNYQKGTANEPLILANEPLPHTLYKLLDLKVSKL